MSRYSEAFKDAIIDKVMSPGSESIRSVAKGFDVPIATLSRLAQTKRD